MNKAQALEQAKILEYCELKHAISIINILTEKKIISQEQAEKAQKIINSLELKQN